MSWAVVTTRVESRESMIVGTFRTEADASDWAHDHCWCRPAGEAKTAAFVVQLTTPAKAAWL